MVIKIKHGLQKDDFLWKKHFAWLPVYVGEGKHAWLQWVEKKRLGVGYIYSL